MRATKHSGVDWLGEIPVDWETKPLYSLGKQISTLNKGEYERNLLSLSYGEIVRKDIESNTGLLPESFEGYQIVEEGDLVFRFTDLQNDQKSLRSALVRERGIITNAYLGFRPSKMDSRFLNYLMRFYDLQKVFYGMGSGLRQSLTFTEVRRLPVVYPSLQAQNRIADFLDHETAKIDTLIAKQEQLITTLDERRGAVISRAVTSGLVEDRPLRDSGHPWIGNIPDHWRTTSLRRLARIYSGGTPDRNNPGFWIDGTVPWLNSGAVNSWAIFEASDFVSVEAFASSSAKWVPEKSVVMGLAGQGKTKGTVARLEIRSTTNQSMAAIVPGRDLDYRYLHLWLSANYQSIRNLAGGDKRDGLNLEHVSSIGIPLPPIQEQNDISDFLDKEVSRAKKLTTKAMEMIGLLDERRQALISAAVTGKLEVGV